MKNTIQSILATLARLTLARYKPRVIAVTGNVGKTSTKEAIYTVVSTKFSARKSEKNYNNEIGVPLTIIGASSARKSVIGWCARIIVACAKLIWCRYPHILILEMGVDKPRDMEYLLSIVRPDMAVFTAIGDMPAHVEYFATAQAMAKEKAKLAHAVRKEGTVILNADVAAWKDALEKTKAAVLTYGCDDDATVHIHTPEYRFEAHGEKTVPLGITFKIEHKGNIVPFRLDGTFGLFPGAYAAGAACAVGIALGMNLVEISSALQNHTSPNGRLKLLEGINSSVILDDTYNASPSSLDAALDALRAIPMQRKIAVLGDMLELGAFTEEAHREAGRKAAAICDVVMTVGERMRFAADEAAVHGSKENEALFSFDAPEDAGRALASMLRAGDLVLVKGSQGMRMEKTVKEIMAHPEDARKLLVRQDRNWVQ